jgi:NADH-quinone oxidoreductase subunit N
MNLGAFGFVILLESKGFAGESIADFAGLARRHPGAAAGMLIFMLGLAGIPPTAGFMGKLYLWAATVEAGYVVLVVISVVMSAVSLYYYFRIVVQMYLKDDRDADAAAAGMMRDRGTGAAVSVCAVLTLAIGVWPGPVVSWAKSGLVALGF